MLIIKREGSGITKNPFFFCANAHSMHFIYGVNPMLEQQLIVGKTYRFTFKPEFERHGVCSTPGLTCLHKGGGVFTVKQITTFADLVRAQNGNLYGSFFEPLGYTVDEMNAYFSGKPETVYEPEYAVQKIESSKSTMTKSGDGTVSVETVTTSRETLVETGKSKAKKLYNDSLNYANFPIYKLVDVVEGEKDAVYVPELAIANVPEVGIKEYRNISLAIDIGYWDKPEQMDCILTRIRQDLLMYGIPPLDINLVAIDSKWMNQMEYDALSKIRVPGVSTFITEANRRSYVGKTAIVGGTTKTIVDKSLTGEKVNLATEIDIGTLIKKKVFIDPGMMLDAVSRIVEDPYKEGTRKVYLDSVFEANTQYLREISSGSYKYLIAGVDYNVSDVLTEFVENSAGKYKDLGPRYEVASEAEIAAGVGLYYLSESYRKITSGTASDSVSYFRKVGNQYIEITLAAGTSISSSDEIYRLNSSEYVAVEASSPIVTEGKTRLYTLTSAHQFVEVESGGTHSKNNLFKINYAAQSAIDLVGKQFTYTPGIGGVQTTTELTAEDIVLFSCVVGQEIRLTNETVSMRYAGYWFVYNDGEGNSIATRLTNNSHVTLRDKRGVICGVTGEVLTETFIEDQSLIKIRNYYQQYLATKRLYDAEVEKNATLIAGHIALTKRIAELEAQLGGK